MTTRELEERVSCRWHGYGTMKVTIEYRGKSYSCLTHNTMATDRINCDEEDKNRKEIGWYSYKGALQALYDECKRLNGLE